MKLHRELENTQKSAWHLAHRLRKTFEEKSDLFLGLVEVDEVYIVVRKAISTSQRNLMLVDEQ